MRLFQDKTIWHGWFAWYPVMAKKLDKDTKELVWLKRIARCKTFSYCFGCGVKHPSWEYRF